MAKLRTRCFTRIWAACQRVKLIPLAGPLTDHLAGIWNQPDEGIWEVRGGPQQFTYSKVMAWVSFDRASRGPKPFI